MLLPAYKDRSKLRSLVKRIIASTPSATSQSNGETNLVELVSICNSIFTEARVDCSQTALINAAALTDRQADEVAGYIISDNTILNAQGDDIGTNPIDALSFVSRVREYYRSYISGDSSGSIIQIHFPEVNLTNGRRSHVIRDLYVGIRFQNTRDKTSIHFLSGCRGTITTAEAMVQYSHSHLHRGYNGNGSAFCLGVAPISTAITKWNYLVQGLKGGLLDDTCRKFWRAMMYQLDDYVRWESLEGRPYISIDNMVATTRTSNGAAPIPLHYTKAKEHANYFIQFLKRSGKSTRELFAIRDGRLSLSDIGHNIIVDGYRGNYQERELIGIYDPETNTYGTIDNDTSRISSYIGKYVTTFKGEEVKLKVSDFENARPNCEKRIYPESRGKIERYIQYRLEESITRQVRAERQTVSGTVREVSQADQVLV
jgi:hypothetical protein